MGDVVLSCYSYGHRTILNSSPTARCSLKTTWLSTAFIFGRTWHTLVQRQENRYAQIILFGYLVTREMNSHSGKHRAYDHLLDLMLRLLVNFVNIEISHIFGFLGK
jgi:hypothetical protein